MVSRPSTFRRGAAEESLATVDATVASVEPPPPEQPDSRLMPMPVAAMVVVIDRCRSTLPIEGGV
jgi:hypothetical protein